MRLRTSPAAEFQVLQTRAKIGATLWSRAVSTITFAWLALTLWTIWHQANVHLYFWQWILCGILNDTPLVSPFAQYLPVPAAGGWYELPSLIAWLNSPNMYGESFYQAFYRVTIGWHGFGTCLLPVACLLLIAAWSWQRNPDGSEHLRGLSLFTPNDLNRQLHGRPWQRGTVPAASSLRFRADQLSGGE